MPKSNNVEDVRKLINITIIKIGVYVLHKLLINIKADALNATNHSIGISSIKNAKIVRQVHITLSKIKYVNLVHFSTHCGMVNIV